MATKKKPSPKLAKKNVKNAPPVKFVPVKPTPNKVTVKKPAKVKVPALPAQPHGEAVLQPKTLEAL